jgi:hypothetical protein
MSVKERNRKSRQCKITFSVHRVRYPLIIQIYRSDYTVSSLSTREYNEVWRLAVNMEEEEEEEEGFNRILKFDFPLIANQITAKRTVYCR